MIDLRGIDFDRFLAHAFERQDHDDDGLQVDPAPQLGFAERLFRDPACLSRFTREQRVRGLWMLPGWSQPELFSGQLWNHDLPIAARISCINAMSVLYRELFSADAHDEDAYMWFDLLEDSAPGQPGDSRAGTFCAPCMPVRNALIGVLQEILALPHPDCMRAALHGLNHWGTDAERARIIDPWLASAPASALDALPPPGGNPPLRQYAPMCRAGKAQ